MKNKLRTAVFALTIAIIVEFSSNLSAQENGEMINVFIDCATCDLDYLKQKVVFIHYVSERKQADLHIIVTAESASGGKKWNLHFIGLNELENKDQVLQFFSQTTDTSDEGRQRFVQILSLGLLRYVAETPLANEISINYLGESNYSVSKGKDPWNYWVMSMSLYGNMNGEKKSNSEYFYGSAKASRITEEWKLSLGSSMDQSKSEYELGDGSIIQNSTASYNHGAEAIKSLSAHLGIGAIITMQRSTFYNLGPSYRALAAIEYNLFPYTESSERALTFTYFTGVTFLNYNEETIFDTGRETLFSEGVRVNFDTKREWGSAGASTQFAHLGKTENRRAIFRGDLDWRITKWLSLSPYGGVEFISDQIYLPKRDLSDEDILLKAHALETDFSYFAGIGLTFSFGSKYGNVVNSRMNSSYSLGKIF